MYRIATSLALCTLLTACSGSRPETDEQGVSSFADVFAAVHEYDQTFHREPDEETCQARVGTYYVDFGVRGLACRIDAAAALESLLARAPGAVFASGPHTVSGDVLELDLERSDNQFGHYRPEFVSWAVENVVAAVESSAQRMVVQQVYDRFVARLARIYWLTLSDLRQEGFPEQIAPESNVQLYVDYLKTGDVPTGMEGYAGEGAISMWGLFERRAVSLIEESQAMIGEEEPNDWERAYEAATAYGFWLRRREDGSLEAFSDGLKRVLATYDGAWFEENQ